ncbi:MAG: MFS transporter [Desulfotignum sp.]|nr:MFS transporter [Desulfotignum sp.]
MIKPVGNFKTAAEPSGRPLSLSLLLRVFLPFAGGYFLSYLFRVVNAGIAPDLAADVGVDPAQLGLLTATYLIAFAAFQLPLGILLDRFGPRLVEAVLLMFAAAGAAVFALSTTLAGLIIGRALIGFGVSACLMAAFKSYVIWFPGPMLSRINGFQMAAGGLGVLAAFTPVEFALRFTDWRGVFLGLGALCVLMAVTVITVVPDAGKKPVSETFSRQIQGVFQVFRSLTFWRIAPLTMLSQAGFMSVQGLWAGPWLRDVASLDRAGTAACMSFSALAMIAGFIILGFVTESLAKRGIPVLYSAVTGMTVFIGILAAMAFGAPIPPQIMMGLFGFFGTAGILSYTALTLSFPSSLSGRVTTGINLLVFLGGFALQWAMGAVINQWEPPLPGHYAPAGYQAAFLLVLGLQFLGLAWFFVSPLLQTRSSDQAGT